MTLLSHHLRLASVSAVVLIFFASTYAQVVIRIPGISGRITGIQEMNSKVWIATTDGLYLVNGNDAKKLSSWSEDILGLDVAAGQLWIRTNERVLRINDNAVEPIIGLHGIIKIVQGAAGQAWIGTSDGLFRVEGNEAKRVPGIQGDVAAIREVAGQVWIGSSYLGVYRIAENVARPIAGVKRFIDPNIDPNEAGEFPIVVEEPVLESVGGQMWFGGHYENTYVIAGGEARPILFDFSRWS
jgi:hypothetical protein